jgi:hypothetical protein
MIAVSASNPRATSTGVERGVDVDFELILPDGRKLSGEVTLLPSEDGRPVYRPWGAPDNWIDGRTLDVIRDLNTREWDEVVDAIEFETSRVAGAPQ